MNLLEKINKSLSRHHWFGLCRASTRLAILPGWFSVLGSDTDADKVEMLNRGVSYIKHIPGAKLASLLDWVNSPYSLQRFRMVGNAECRHLQNQSLLFPFLFLRSFDGI